MIWSYSFPLLIKYSHNFGLNLISSPQFPFKKCRRYVAYIFIVSHNTGASLLMVPINQSVLPICIYEQSFLAATRSSTSSLSQLISFLPTWVINLHAATRGNYSIPPRPPVRCGLLWERRGTMINDHGSFHQGPFNIAFS